MPNCSNDGGSVALFEMMPAIVRSSWMRRLSASKRRWTRGVPVTDSPKQTAAVALATARMPKALMPAADGRCRRLRVD